MRYSSAKSMDTFEYLSVIHYQIRREMAVVIKQNDQNKSNHLLLKVLLLKLIFSGILSDNVYTRMHKYIALNTEL